MKKIGIFMIIMMFGFVVEFVSKGVEISAIPSSEVCYTTVDGDKYCPGIGSSSGGPSLGESSSGSTNQGDSFNNSQTTENPSIPSGGQAQIGEDNTNQQPIDLLGQDEEKGLDKQTIFLLVAVGGLFVVFIALIMSNKNRSNQKI